MSPRFERRVTEVDPEVFEYLQDYDWPGNVRELQNVVERVLLLAEDGHITVDCLPREITRPAGYTQLRSAPGHGHKPRVDRPEPAALLNRNHRKSYAQEQEKEDIIHALNRFGGNVSKAAAELGISRYTLYRRMKSYDISN